MDALENLKTRRSIRYFSGKPVEDAVIDKIMDAAVYAPTGQGKQLPQIVVVRDPATQDQLRRMNAEVMGRETDPYYGAPVIVVVLAPNDGNTYVEDGVCVLTYMMLAAHEAGLGSCWVHRERQIFASPEGKALLAKWGVPDKFEGIGALALGYIDGEPPEPAPRREGYVLKV
ncbi:MAG: nitroreductase family protein [Clostridiales bacterium]|nr:nitroreductase family protein [Clostridiales bacterium]